MHDASLLEAASFIEEILKYSHSTKIVTRALYRETPTFYLVVSHNDLEGRWTIKRALIVLFLFLEPNLPFRL